MIVCTKEEVVGSGGGEPGPIGPRGYTGPAGPPGSGGGSGLSAWSAGGTYVVGDVVSEGGSLWICIDPVTGSGMPPQLDTVNWASTALPQIQRFEVDSVADLVLLAGLPDGKLISLLGYRVPGDGGEQSLIYHATGRSTLGAQTNNGGIYFNGPGADDYHASVNKYVVNILQFGARPNVANDSTPFIQAAINYCKSFAGTQTEVDLIWPGGTYKVTTLNYVGCERVTNKAEGGVTLNGTSVGGVAVISIDGATSILTRQLNWEGGFSVQIGGGAETYQYGIYINGLQGSRIAMSLSGPFSVNTVYIDYSWDNEQLDFVASNSSGTAIATIYCASNNVNRNRFNCRTTAINDMAIAAIGFELGGNTNVLEGDFSTSQTGIRVRGGLGNVILAPYFEVNKYGVRLTNNAVGTTIIGGLFEVSTDGAAYDLSSSTNTTVLGGRVFGNSSVGQTNRSAFILGAACYALNVSNVDISQSSIDQAYTGTWRGLQGGFVRQMNTVCAHWVSFPPTAIPSDDPNTIDDFERGSWTPVGNTITLVAASGRYVKIANMVTLFFEITFPAIGQLNSNTSQITGLPYSSQGNGRNGAALGFVNNPNNNNLYANGVTLRIVSNLGVEQLNNQLADNSYYGSITYLTDVV